MAAIVRSRPVRLTSADQPLAQRQTAIPVVGPPLNRRLVWLCGRLAIKQDGRRRCHTGLKELMFCGRMYLLHPLKK